MQTSQSERTQFPPDVLRYLDGPQAESRQFDFLIGEWQVNATRYREDGSPLLHYQAYWQARYLNGGRMVMDDFRAVLPGGEEISSFVTLRTYSEIAQRWEITGLAALQAAANAEWYGKWVDGEMLLDAIGRSPTGQSVHNKIRFYDIKDDSFAWESQISLDEGKSWRKAASLQASRMFGQ